MLVSSVQAVVACYVGAPRVCTLVLFILVNRYMYAYITSLGSGLGGGALMAHLHVVPSPNPKSCMKPCMYTIAYVSNKVCGRPFCGHRRMCVPVGLAIL